MDDKTLYTPLTLDVQHVNFPDVIAVSRDTLRGWRVTPLNDGALLDLASGDKCELWSIGASQDVPVFSQGQVEGGKLILPILPEMLQDGYVTQTVVLKRASGTVRFGSFRLWVDGAVDDYGSTGGAGKSQWQDMLDKLNAAMAKAEHYRNEAETSASLAAECQKRACECATKAEGSKTQAASSAQKAKSSADSAANSAGNARTSAAEAKASETAAKTSADTASSKATQAATSASKAKSSETAAASSATKAKSSETAAAESSKSAKLSADSAAQSKASAATSASTATTKAGEASQSASVAVDAKNAAVTAKGQAAASASAAKTSAGSASASATSAGQSKTAAETAKSKAQEIADSLQGTVDNANQAADRANAAAKKADQAAQTSQPDATNTSKGIVQIGEGIEVTDGIISVDLSGKSDKTHTHSISGVRGLDKALADAGKVKSVNGATGDVKINAVPGGGTTGQVLKKTSSGYGWGTDNNTKYTHPSSHPISMIEGLQAALDGKKDLTTHWIRNKDTRAVNSTPAWYVENFSDGLVLEFKQYKTIGTPRGSKGGSYNFLATYIPFRDARDFSGGLPTQMAFADDRVYVRGAKDGTDPLNWGPWRELANTDAVNAVKTTVINSLTSSSTTSALSANQGKVLNEKILKTDKKFGEVSQIKVLTQAQYKALSTKDPGTLYLVKEG